MIKNTLLTLGVCLLVAAARAEDHFSQSRLANWHHWRGPLASGTAPEADPPIKWDEKTNIQWKAPLPGRGSASPIVWGNRVFVLTAVKTDRVATADELPKPDPRFERKTSPPANFYQFLVLCFDRATGKIRCSGRPPSASPMKAITRLIPTPPVRRQRMDDFFMLLSVRTAFIATTWRESRSGGATWAGSICGWVGARRSRRSSTATRSC